MECCRLIPAGRLINENPQFVCKCNLGAVSSAHLHLVEKIINPKFNVAIIRVYGGIVVAMAAAAAAAAAAAEEELA